MINNYPKICLSLSLSSEAATRGVLLKEAFLKILQNSHEAPVPESLFNKVADQTCDFIKKEALTQVFSCEFC